MEEIEWGVPAEIIRSGDTEYQGTLAAGLFGRDALVRRIHGFHPVNGYIRDLEQMPNFTLPSVEQFVKNYMQSYAAITTGQPAGYC
ncbi:hypothetical protein SAMN02745824_2645 [Parasphingorhabdus marina DSM 22363]|uniref:Uncharacterized protein n=1 Tax=Parasphingorhabdus marina DSM 22363 TaxID=1123272 RepID=A0A1N6G261_9SPHN|nr:hypothetical protein [Parasphingorhabdus marina]SIO01666.1 hypothetical protein SAMN02745824_2645 [Parasphingorhabdus marina DSM 22363]